MSFDPQSFLDAAVTGSNDTKIIPVPMGEYMGIIDKVAPRQWQSKDGTQSGVRQPVEVACEIGPPITVSGNSHRNGRSHDVHTSL